MKKNAMVRGKSAPGAAKGHKKGGPPGDESQSLSLFSEISQEITSILDRDELFGRIADRVKKVVDYHLFSVMLWNEKSTPLEIVFSVHFGEPIPVRFRVPLYKGITGHAAGERCTNRPGSLPATFRFSSLWRRVRGPCSRRCVRQGNRGGSLRCNGHRNFA